MKLLALHGAADGIDQQIDDNCCCDASQSFRTDSKPLWNYNLNGALETQFGQLLRRDLAKGDESIGSCPAERKHCRRGGQGINQ